MVRGAALKRKMRLLKKSLIPVLKKVRNFATNPEALTSRALGLIGPSSPQQKDLSQYYTPTTTIPKRRDLIFCTLNMIRFEQMEFSD